MTLDPTVSIAALAGFESLINKALNYDPASRNKLAALTGKVLAIEITSPISAHIYLLPDDDGLILAGDWAGSVDTRLRGSAQALVGLLFGDHKTLAGTGVELIGSSNLLVQIQTILSDLDIDWEDALSDYLGDITSHALANHLRGKGRWLKDRLSSGQRLVGEYLTEELEATPHKYALAEFNRGVDEFVLAVDKLEARFNKLADKKGQSRNHKDTR